MSAHNTEAAHIGMAILCSSFRTSAFFSPMEYTFGLCFFTYSFVSGDDSLCDKLVRIVVIDVRVNRPVVERNLVPSGAISTSRVRHMGSSDSEDFTSSASFMLTSRFIFVFYVLYFLDFVKVRRQKSEKSGGFITTTNGNH